VRVFGVSFRKHPAALDRLLLERFGGMVGRGLALEVYRRRDTFHSTGISFGHGLIKCTKANERRKV
jgi:hypothetical protein